eukprot:3709036-Rhodomonas_salina.1
MAGLGAWFAPSPARGDDDHFGLKRAEETRSERSSVDVANQKRGRDAETEREDPWRATPNHVGLHVWESGSMKATCERKMIGQRTAQLREQRGEGSAMLLSPRHHHRITKTVR